MSELSRSLSLSRPLVRQWRRAWLRLGALLLVGLLASPIALLEPLPLKLAIDSVLSFRPLPGFLDAIVPSWLAHSASSLLLVVGAMIVFIALLSHVQSLAQAYLSKRAGEQMAGELRAAMLRQLERISLPYHDGSRSADWIRRIQRDASAIQKLLIDAFIPLVSSAVTLLALSYAMLRLDWELALIVLALSPPLILAARSYRPLLSRQAREVKNLERFTLAVVGEGFGPLRILNASRREERESERFLQRAARGIRARTRARLAERRFGLILGVIAATGMAALVLLGIDHVRASILLLGNFLLLLAYAAKLEKTIQAISGKTVALRGYLAGAERAFALLDQVPAVTEQRPARPIARARGEVAFRGVSLSDDRGQTVLYGVSFELEAGTRVGITGATGAAKSALISLLTRLCDPTDGRILLDGVDIRDYRLDDLRRQFAVVPREPVLSSGSIGENIGSGAPGASRERIVAAALAANAHEFVERLPDGYDTQVGERGVKLSWAKRQAIILARAFLRDSPILILENPPGAVETPTDSATAVALERLKQGRTVIAIGADPSSVAGCAEVLQLKHGRIVGDTARSHFTLRRPSLPGPGASGDAPLDRTRLLAHPAVQAWCRLGPERPLPTRVVPAKFKTHTKRKINVYRLEDVAPAGGSVIAKRCRSTAGAIERLVYEQYLPRLAVPTAGYLGSVEEPAEHGRTWIFTRELTGEPFVNDDPVHQVYAARWLAALHAGAHAIGRHPEIPANDSRRYLEHLRHARELIHTHVNNPILMPEDVALLETLLARLDDLERGWDRLESWCAGAPQTLVHGDFSSKNIFVKSTGGQPGIVVYDWECAGWGPPAVDLAQFALPANRRAANPDLATYWEGVRDLWPDRDRSDVERLADCGTVFRVLAALDWAAPALEYEWAPWQIPEMRLAEADLMFAVHRLDAGQRSRGRVALAGSEAVADGVEANRVRIS